MIAAQRGENVAHNDGRDGIRVRGRHGHGVRKEAGEHEADETVREKHLRHQPVRTGRVGEIGQKKRCRPHGKKKNQRPDQVERCGEQRGLARIVAGGRGDETLRKVPCAAVVGERVDQQKGDGKDAAYTGATNAW